MILTSDGVGNYLAKDSFKVCISRIKKDYKFNWHHELIIERLERFLSDPNDNKLMIFAPPQTGKSECTSRLFPSFAMGQNPNSKIGIISYSDTIASGFNSAAQNYMLSEEYRLIFPDTRIPRKGNRQTSEKVYKRRGNFCETIGKEGFIKSTGVNGSLTGTPLDIGIIDDPIKGRKESLNPKRNDELYQWYTDVFKTRLHNSSKILLMMTRWTDDDLAGKILEEEEGWDIMKLQALKTDDYHQEGDPREVGEALWESMHSKKRMEEIKDKTPETFNSMYQQEPDIKGGNIIKDENIYTLHPAMVPAEVYGMPFSYYCDSSYTKNENNDPNGILKVKLYKNRLYVFDFIKWWQDATEALDTFVDILEADGQIGPLHIENKASGLTYIDLLVTRGINAIEFKHDGNDKEARLRFIKEYFMSRRVVFVEGKYLSNFTKTLKRFPKVKTKEEVDTIVMAVIDLLVEGTYTRRSGGRR